MRPVALPRPHITLVPGALLEVAGSRVRRDGAFITLSARKDAPLEADVGDGVPVVGRGLGVPCVGSEKLVVGMGMEWTW